MVLGMFVYQGALAFEIWTGHFPGYCKNEKHCHEPTRRYHMLTGKQKRFLRSKAHHLNPIFQVGKGGVNENMVSQLLMRLKRVS